MYDNRVEYKFFITPKVIKFMAIFNYGKQIVS